MSTIEYFFCLWNIELNWQQIVVVHRLSGFWRQVGEKFIHTFLSSFPRFLPVFMSVIPWVSSYGGVWNPQGSSHICISVKLDLFRCPARDRKSPPQRRTTLNIFGKEADLGGNLFHKQSVYHHKSVNIQQSFRLGRRVTLYREVLINVNRNLQKAV